MLPFLKKEGSTVASPTEEVLRRKSDDGEPYEMLDAIAEDLLAAFESKDKTALKSALESLCSYIQDMDQEQDELLTQEGSV